MLGSDGYFNAAGRMGKRRSRWKGVLLYVCKYQSACVSGVAAPSPVHLLGSANRLNVSAYKSP